MNIIAICLGLLLLLIVMCLFFLFVYCLAILIAMLFEYWEERYDDEY